MRKLASIQRVWDIEAIEGADKIELAHVLGWQCVVNKGQFKKMDKAVYFEVDSFLPLRREYEFLRSNSYRNSNILGEGYKLRTMRFRGKISQGLLLPVSYFPELSEDMEIGLDVSDLLGVRKWEIEEKATIGGNVIGTLPYDVPHTDETRVQAEPELIEEFAGMEYYISTKMDGSSHSVSIDGDGFHVTGHNFEYKDDGSSSFYRFINENGLKDRMYGFCRRYGVNTLTIQGEFCAPGIQQNKLKLLKPEWYVFTVRIDGKRVGLKLMLEACGELCIEHVPIEEIGFDLPSVYPDVDSLLVRAEGEYPKGGAKEGIVIRPTEPVYCELISASLSMKVVNNKYLLKNGE